MLLKDAQTQVNALLNGEVDVLETVPFEHFNTLKAKLEVTEGTLSVHLRKLEDAGHISIEKSFRNRRPLTQARLSESGRKAFRAYLDAMGKLAGLGD